MGNDCTLPLINLTKQKKQQHGKLSTASQDCKLYPRNFNWTMAPKCDTKANSSVVDSISEQDSELNLVPTKYKGMHNFDPSITTPGSKFGPASKV
jgi:hypothetical protein